MQVVSHLVAYSGNDPDRVECALFPARQALYSRGANQAPGWGLGFALAGDVLLQKRPRPESAEVDFFALGRGLRADAIVARAGRDEGARAAAAEDDPFRFRSWLFATAGSADGFDRIRDRVLASVPDFLRRNIRGTSASEHVFHLFLAFLHDAGLLEAMTAPPAALAKALRESAAFADRLLTGTGSPSPHMALAVTNGRSLVVLSTGHPVQYLQIQGIADCTVCRDRNEIGRDDRRISHESLRAVIVEADEGGPGRPGWQSLPPQGALLVGVDRVATVT
jgi:glutamine amidotransferase